MVREGLGDRRPGADTPRRAESREVWGGSRRPSAGAGPSPWGGGAGGWGLGAREGGWGELEGQSHLALRALLKTLEEVTGESRAEKLRDLSFHFKMFSLSAVRVNLWQRASLMTWEVQPSGIFLVTNMPRVPLCVHMCTFFGCHLT